MDDKIVFTKNQYVKKLILFMETEKPYLSADLTLAELSKQVNIPTHHLSQTINEKLECNFLDFINFPRAILTLKYIIFYSLDHVIFPITMVCLLIMIKYDKKNIFILPFSLMFILGFGFFMAAFLLTSFPLEWVLWVSLKRIIFETNGLYVILVPLFYDFLKRKKIFNNI